MFMFVFLQYYLLDPDYFSPHGHMTQIHLPPKFPVGLTIGIQQDDGLVHLGEFGVNDLLDPGNLWIIRTHNVRIELVVLLDLPVFLDNLVLFHIILSNALILIPSPMERLRSWYFRNMAWKGELDDLY